MLWKLVRIALPTPRLGDSNEYPHLFYGEENSLLKLSPNTHFLCSTVKTMMYDVHQIIPQISFYLHKNLNFCDK